MIRFTMQDLKAKGIHVNTNGIGKKITNVVGTKPKKNQIKATIKIKKPESKEKLFIEQALKDAGINFKKEEKFLENRKFRFDYSFELNDKFFNKSVSLYIEYDGTIISPKNKYFTDKKGIRRERKSRHTTITGFSKDCEKLNLAAINGWRGLRYTALNYKNIVNDLKLLLQ